MIFYRKSFQILEDCGGEGKGKEEEESRFQTTAYTHADFEFQDQLTYPEEAAECGLKGRTVANEHYARLQDRGRIGRLGPATLCLRQCLLFLQHSTTVESVMVELPDWTLPSTVERNFLTNVVLSLAWAGP